MNPTFARIACALALSTTAGCADFTFSYVEDAVLEIPVKDIGSACETDDPIDTDIARAHVEQEGDVCVITAAALVRAIEYADVEEGLDAVDLQDEGTYWSKGGLCWRAADDADVNQAYEKCDYGPYVQAEWRLAGEDAWSSNPDFPDQATADLDIAYYPGPVATLDDLSGDALPALLFSTSGQSFPGGPVTFSHDKFFDPFQEAAGDQEDLYSAAHARVEVPMSVIADFSEHEYQITFKYQMYVQVAVTEESFWEIIVESWFGGGDDDEA